MKVVLTNEKRPLCSNKIAACLGNKRNGRNLPKSRVFYPSRWLLNPELRPRDAHKRNPGDFQDLHVVDSSSCPGSDWL